MNRKLYGVFAAGIIASGGLGFFLPSTQRIAALLSVVMLLTLWAILITGRVRSWRRRGYRAQVREALGAFAEETGSQAFGMNDARFTAWLHRSSGKNGELKERIRGIRREWASLAKALIGSLAIFIIAAVGSELLRGRL